MRTFGLTLDEFTDIAAHVAAADARCLNPACDARLTYRESKRGRQALYCNDICRRSAWRSRERLKASLKAVIESHELLERPATALELRTIESKLRWLLARYPAEGRLEDADDDDRFADHVPATVTFARMDDDWTKEALAEAGRYDARMRLKYMNRRRRPLPVTPSLTERQRASIALQRRHEVERILRVDVGGGPN